MDFTLSSSLKMWTVSVLEEQARKLPQGEKDKLHSRQLVKAFNVQQYYCRSSPRKGRLRKYRIKHTTPAKMIFFLRYIDIYTSYIQFALNLLPLHKLIYTYIYI